MSNINLGNIAFFLMAAGLALLGAMYNLQMLLVLFGGILLAYGLYFLLFGVRSAEKVMAANEANKGKRYLTKYPEVDIQKFSTPFLLTGLIISMGFSMASFMWQEEVEPPMDLGEVMILDEIEQLPPQSIQKPPPPPPPPPPPKLEIVEDEEIIEEEPEIIDTEVEEDTEVEIPDVVIEEIEEEGEEEIIEEEVVEEEEPEEPEIFTIVEQMPEFKGGQAEMFKFIGKNVKYPPMARENGIEGTVFVSFVVNEDGSITNAQVRRGLAGGGAGCDAEALRVVKMMPKWTAGKQRGKPVKVSFTLPIKFKLE